MDTEKLMIILIQAGSFISAFAAIAAGVMMASVRKKFGTGILASGFKSISVGVFFIAGGILADAVQSYISLNFPTFMVGIIAVLIIKEILFVVGTYIIVIGSKKTGDKLESLTK